MKKNLKETHDPAILRNRVTVTDNELTYLLGTSKNTARKMAEQMDAVIYVGGRRLNVVDKIVKGTR